MLSSVEPAAAEETSASMFRESTTVTLIEVPVVVLRGGSPVKGLSSADFVVTVDGEEQILESFEQIDLTVHSMTDAAAGEPPISLAGRRYFLLAFDLSHTQPANARRAVDAARQLVEAGLHPTDLVAVSVYSAVAGARLIHPFTSDQAQLELALLAVEAVTGRRKEVVEKARQTLAASDGESAEDLGRFLEEIRRFTTKQAVGLESTMGPAGEWLDGFDTSGRGAVMAETLRDMEAFNDENQIYIVRDRSLDLLGTLADLATALEDVQGQKNFVLFSEGIDQSFFEDYSNTQGLRLLAEALSSFRQSGWVMHSVNVMRGANTERGLFALADETGGREYRDFNRLDEAMGQMLERTSVSYVLGFQPTEVTADGSYRRIKVRLRQGDGATVRHRDGFYAPSSQIGDVDEDYLVAVADRVASEKDGGPFQVNAIAVPFRNTEETSLIKLVVEIDGQELLNDPEALLLPLEIDTYLIGDDVGAVRLSTRRLTLDLARQGELLRGGGIKILDDYLLPPGDCRLRVAVAVTGSGRRSVVTVDARVPDFEMDEPQLLDPIFPEISRNWVVVRENEGDGQFVPNPGFEFAGRRYVPRVEVLLESGTVAPVFVLAFGLPEEVPAMQLELIGTDGSRHAGEFLKVTSQPEHATDGLVQIMAELNTSELTPDRYEIRVTFGGDAETPVVMGSRFLQIR